MMSANRKLRVHEREWMKLSGKRQKILYETTSGAGYMSVGGPKMAGGVKRVKLLYEKAKVAKDEGYGDRRPVIGISPMSYTTEDLSRETYDRIDGALK